MSSSKIIALEALSILVVDDDAFFLKIVKITLLKLGIKNVDMATNGAETLASLAESIGRYDVILSDLNMPHMDGIELLRNLARLRFAGGVVLLTAADLKILKAADTLARAHGLHLLGVLSKPLDKDALGQLLEAFRFRDKHQPQRKSLPVTHRQARAAIAEGQFIAHFQPQVEVATRRMVGMEALARWLHPEHGLIPAGAFIPLIESSGLVSSLTEVMLRDVMRQMSALSDLFDVPRVSINVSMESLMDVNFPDRVQAIADEFKFPLGQLVLEITESQLMADVAAILDSLIRLRLKGVALAVDDFGTGYSNLAQLKHAPVSELKIDRSFVTMGCQDEEGRVILETAISMGKKLGMRVVAEGVEDLVEWELVQALGVDEVQGYFVARPMPAAELASWLERWESRDITAETGVASRLSWPPAIDPSA